jgi:hypothetical protein
VPMLLNTSFNTLPKEPIVESPQHAIRSFLASFLSSSSSVVPHHHFLAFDSGGGGGGGDNDDVTKQEDEEADVGACGFKSKGDDDDDDERSDDVDYSMMMRDSNDRSNVFSIGRLVMNNKVYKRKPIPSFLTLESYSSSSSSSSASSSKTTATSSSSASVTASNHRLSYSLQNHCWYDPATNLPVDVQQHNHFVNKDINNDHFHSNKFEEQLKKCFPVARYPPSSITSRVSAYGDGSVSQVEVQIPGFQYESPRWVKLTDDLELSILESCNGISSLDQIIDQFVTTTTATSTTSKHDNDNENANEDDNDEIDGDDNDDEDEVDEEVSLSDVLSRVSNLWQNTLIKL